LKNTNITLFYAYFRSGFLTDVYLKPTSRLCLLALLSHFNNESGALYPSLEKLAFECGCTKKQITRAIQDLIEHKVIDVIKGTYQNKEKNFYSFNPSFILKLKDLMVVKKTPSNIKMSDNLSQILESFCPDIGVKKTTKHESKHENITINGFNYKNSKYYDEFKDVFEKLHPEDIKIYLAKPAIEKKQFLIDKRKETNRQLRMQFEAEKRELDKKISEKEKLSPEEVRRIVSEKYKRPPLKTTRKT